MEHYEEVTETRKQLVKVTCDICGKPLENDIENDGSEHNYVNMEHRYSYSYSGIQFGTEFKPDICGPCFVSKITPFLESLGVKIAYKESPY